MKKRKPKALRVFLYYLFFYKQIKYYDNSLWLKCPPHFVNWNGEMDMRFFKEILYRRLTTKTANIKK